MKFVLSVQYIVVYVNVSAWRRNENVNQITITAYIERDTPADSIVYDVAWG